MDGWTDGLEPDGWIRDRQMDGQMDRQMDFRWRTDGWTDGLETDGVNRQMDGLEMDSTNPFTLQPFSIKRVEGTDALQMDGTNPSNL